MAEESDKQAGYLAENHRLALEAILLDYRITIISCLHWSNHAPWHVPWRKCPDTFLLFPQEGEVQVTLKGRAFSLKPGQFLMLAENTRHALELASGSRRLRQFALHCHIHDRWGRPLVSRFSSPLGVLPSGAWGATALAEMACLMGHNSRAGQIRGKTFLREVLAAQLSAGTQLVPQPPAGDPRVGVAIDTMEREIGSPELSVEGLARRTGITSVQLRKLFRRETGMSPRRFLISLRLRQAARLLQHSTESMKEIATSCGFASDHYFHLVFRRHFLCTPSAYRRRIGSQV